MRKRAPGGPLSAAELRQRREAARSQRHEAETAPSVVQGSTGAPSRAAVGLFRQGQQRPDTRAGRGVWDTRTTEAPVGSVKARLRLHFPNAYRSKLPEEILPQPKGRHLLAEALADEPQRKGKRISGSRYRVGKDKPYRDLTIENPDTFVEALRHPQMRDIMQRAIGVVREHQAGTLARGKRMIPPGTSPGTQIRAYKHAALLALHRAGVVDYDFGPMDAAAKRELKPLEPFMRYAHRRVFDRLHTQNPEAFEPFKQEFGTKFSEHRHGKLVGKERYRMRPNERFIKRAPKDKFDPTRTAQIVSGAAGGIGAGAALSHGRVARNVFHHVDRMADKAGRAAETRFRFHARKAGAFKAGRQGQGSMVSRAMGIDPKNASESVLRAQGKLVGRAARGVARMSGRAGVAGAAFAAGDYVGDKIARRVTGDKKAHYRHFNALGFATGTAGAVGAHLLTHARFARKFIRRFPLSGRAKLIGAGIGLTAGAEAVGTRLQDTAKETLPKHLRKDWTNSTGVIRSPGRGPTDQPWQRRRGDEDQAGNTAGANREAQIRRPIRHAAHNKIGGAARQALHHGQGVRLSLNKPVPELPHGKPPPADPMSHVKHAAIAVEQHFGVGKIEGAAAPDPEMQKVSGTFRLGDPDPQPDFGFYNTNPAAQLRRAMRPRVRRRRMTLRLNTQRHLRRLLSGGITRQERWQLGSRGFSTAQKAEGLDSTDALGKALTQHPPVYTLKDRFAHARKVRRHVLTLPDHEREALYQKFPAMKQPQGGRLSQGRWIIQHEKIGTHLGVERDPPSPPNPASLHQKNFTGYKPQKSIRAERIARLIAQAIKAEPDGDLEKGVIGAAMQFGSTHLKPMLSRIGGAAMGAKSAVGGAMRTAGSKVVHSAPAQRVAGSSVGQKVLQNPRMQAMGREARRIGRTGSWREGTLAGAGRIAGAGIAGKRGARIGRNLGLVPEAVTLGTIGAGVAGAVAGRRKRDPSEVEKISPSGALTAIRGAASKVIEHPRVAAALSEIRDWPQPRTPLYRLGRIVGASAGGERGAKIGGIVGHATEIAPFAYAGAKVISNRRKRKEQLDRLKHSLPGASLVLGKNLASAALGATMRGAGHVLGGGARLGFKAVRRHPLIAGAAAGAAAIPVMHHLQGHRFERAGVGAAVGGTIAALATHGRVGPSVMRSTRAIYQTGLKDAVRAHLRTLAGGGHSPHQVAQANAVLAASKRHLLQQARKARIASRRTISGGAVAGVAGVGGLAGLATPSRSKWEDVPP